MKSHTSRILLYSQDGLGLGHLRRNVNIAHELSRLEPDTTFLFVVDSPLAPFFKLPPNSKLLKLPTLIKLDAGVYAAYRAALTTGNGISRRRSRAIMKAALEFHPDVVLVDHMPHGPMGELIRTLQILRRDSPKTRIVLGLRDILGAPETIVRQWGSEGAYQAIAEYYDHVFVYGCHDVYNLISEYDFSEELRLKTQYCGYVVCNGTEDYSISATQSFAAFSAEKPFTVIVMGGGGSDAHFLMDITLDAIRYLGSKVPFNTFILTGPFMPSERQRALSRKAQGMPVIIEHMAYNIVKYLHHVDLVVSMAGYNTICEILKFGKKAIVVPRAGPSAEQNMRAKIFLGRRLVRSITPDVLTAKRLGETAVRCLYEKDKINMRQVPNLSGASYTARLLLDYVAEVAKTKEIPLYRLITT
jgi:predicted glycosyltransferase